MTKPKNYGTPKMLLSRAAVLQVTGKHFNKSSDPMSITDIQKKIHYISPIYVWFAVHYLIERGDLSHNGNNWNFVAPAKKRKLRVVG